MKKGQKNMTLEELKRENAELSKVNFEKVEHGVPVYSQNTGLQICEVDVYEYNSEDASPEDKIISEAFTEFKNELKAIKWQKDWDMDERVFKTHCALNKKMRPLWTDHSASSFKIHPVDDNSKMYYIQFSWTTNLNDKKMWKRYGVVYLENLWKEGGSQIPETIVRKDMD